MKKTIALVLALACCGSMFVGCQSTSAQSSSQSTASQTSSAATAKPATISVVTSYGGDDGNKTNYETAYKAFEKATGNTVKDMSGTSNEQWKAKIMADFETGSEPDVLFYFNGVDSNKLVSGGKVVSIDEIRKVYPDYASNMKDELLGASPVDNKNYSVPVNGYWEGLYVNKKVLKDCGIEVPTASYTWDQFLKDCGTIKAKGYTPIACSLQEVPHYWFEYCVFNHDTLATHTKLPAASTDDAGKAWVAGLNDIKTLYTSNYFPKNTNTAKDAETFQLLYDNKAAFAIDGSWKIGDFQKKVAKNLDDFTVTYVPAQNQRKATDLIGGLSMGYFITKKAWNDPAKQKACVDFVKAMTTDSVVSTFGATAVTALKNGTTASNLDSLQQAAIAMTKGATGIVAATQDGMAQPARTALFADVKNIAAGKTTADKALDSALAVK
ncbi:MAG TPA: ABC transporter substrate-binding protein [Oscillospiraceae bacterium]|nr:ABC transporter substrate-binding protein [Oscillospiraceae bacterium]